MADFNVSTVELDDRDGPPGLGLRDAPFHAERLAGAVLEIAPGKAGLPYHWDAAREQLLLVLDGRPTLRRPDGDELLGPGDIVGLPIGPEGAHGLRNDSGSSCRLLVVSTRAPADVVVRPDTGEVLVSAAGFERTFRVG